MDFTNFSIDELMGFGEESNPLIMLIWIIPIIIFVFYGQRIQLQVTLGDINKKINQLKQFRDESRKELLDYINKNLKPSEDPKKKIDGLMEYFTIMPVDMDPNGIIPKVNHLIRSREHYTKLHVKSLFSKIDELELSKVQNLVEIVTTLQLLYKITRHLYLTAKKQNNYPLILPLQMIIPFIMEEATAIKEAVLAIEKGQPLGDGIGPMVVGQMMLETKKQEAAYETVWSEKEYEGRSLMLVKAKGPFATVGRLADAVNLVITYKKPDIIVMIDASLKLEGEDSATTAQGFGAAIGGIGTDRFQIEEVATKHSIPIFAIVIKESIKEAVTLMTKEIAARSDDVRLQLDDMIKENTKPGQSILVIGVGNTLGVSQ